MILSSTISYVSISTLYYNRRIMNNEVIKHIDYESVIEAKKKNKKVLIASIIIMILSVCGATVFTYEILSGKANLNIEYTRALEVTAHRGASTICPENTMSAFKKAHELGADWIELDVGETKDNKIIVMHDSNFKRTTKVNKEVYDVFYDEVKTYDAGNGEKIPLLEEVIEYASKNNIKLNIELKPTGRENNLEKNVIDIVEKYSFIDRCIITSATYKVLENVKKINSDIKTAYVMSIAIGNITLLDKADVFSIESSNVTENLVKKVHNSGKELLVWTVNNESSINKMIDLNVDNIITDEITLAKNTIIKSKSSNIVSEYVKIVKELFG